MLAKVMSAACIGIEAHIVEIEVDIASGLPQIVIVGLPDQAVKESKDRIRAAIKNSSFTFPKRKKIVINLAPADVKKEGPIFDLPIALGILAASGLVNLNSLQSFCIIGELALDGTLRETKGALPIALHLNTDSKKLVLPLQNAKEAALQQTVAIHAVKNLGEAVRFINNEITIPRFMISYQKYLRNTQNYPFDFNEVRGQSFAKRALEIAVNGAHNILMIGPPGSGKTMLAKRLPSIFPDLTHEEALEITKIQSASGALRSREGFISRRPFRAPHHTISPIALAGGGPFPKPGEVSLSHNGVLFLDELPEFNRNVLEVLRSPMEDGIVTIARAKHVMTFPAKFMLVCAMNPCPCGYYGDKRKECHCTLPKIERYASKISGPLMDRIDMHIEVRRVPYEDLEGEKQEESSHNIRKRINKVRLLQEKRFSQYKNIYFNAQMGPHEIKRYCQLRADAQHLLALAIKELAFSARAYHKILKIARTIRDMKTVEKQHSAAVCSQNNTLIDPDDISEALQYRSLDRNWFGE